MKVFAVVSVGRQIEGEQICIRFDKTFTSATKAEAFLKELLKTTTEMVQTPYGAMSFMVERSLYELDVEEGD